ncbi:hypothetical protein DITRI_Ditri04bG0068100 [Diplodiscus trichospermus]
MRLYGKGLLTGSTQVSNTNETVWRLLWAGLAPPKVECFYWQVLKGRLAVKKELLKRGILQQSDAISWKVWMYRFSIWDVKWCSPFDTPSVFYGVAHGTTKGCFQ